MRIFLDDERWPTDVTWVDFLHPSGWTVVRNFDQFVRVLWLGEEIEEISFDHDLGEELTGNDCAKELLYYLIFTGYPMPQCYIHTMNPVGRDNIKATLDSYERILGLDI